ncbi:MAG: hypothetical protein HN929_04930 [Chloroflexi bacterium]|jgi:hypothetical protein|nr:hypothetical protein [Chloroflexota bacterium]MBT7080797.1 hypothetical protein [Chloroflexota bacterium]MBT7289313.1 hypothetical protein [Chloroflexota bacterium]
MQEPPEVIKERIYNLARGEYLSKMASIEHRMTSLIVDLLGVQNFTTEFHWWFLEARIPFEQKVSLLKELIKGETYLNQFGDISKKIIDAQKFRNKLAHSFHLMDEIMTSRGEILQSDQISLKVLSNKLGQIHALNILLGDTYMVSIYGGSPPISVEEYKKYEDYRPEYLEGFI